MEVAAHLDLLPAGTRALAVLRGQVQSETPPPHRVCCAQQKPCEYATIIVLTKLLSGFLFIWDIVSDILVLTQLSAAGAVGPMALGIVFM